MPIEVELNDETLPKGSKLHVTNLGELENGKSVKFKPEEIERFEAAEGRSIREAFKEHPNVKVSGSKEGGN